MSWKLYDIIEGSPFPQKHPYLGSADSVILMVENLRTACRVLRSSETVNTEPAMSLSTQQGRVQLLAQRHFSFMFLGQEYFSA